MINKKLVLLYSLLTIYSTPVIAKAALKKTVAPVKNITSLNPSWPDIFDEVKESTVQIFACKSPFNFHTPYQKDPQQNSSGSGFFVLLKGELAIITNYHVIDKADVIYMQHPNAWKELIELEFVGGSPEFDVARLQFKPGQRALLEQKMGNKQIKTLELGDSDLIRQGENVMLVGYPLGAEHIKHATGTISGHESISNCGECFTTTAASFPGNSGGACVNQHGKVVGILVAGENQQGLNYVLPITREKVVLDELKDGKVLEWPFWGLSGSATTPDTFAYLKVPGDGGLLVTHVEKNSLFGAAGLQKNDVISTFIVTGKRMPIDRFGYVTVPWSSYKMEFYDVLGRIHYGDTFFIECWRNGKKITLAVTKKLGNPYQIKRKYLPFDAEPAYEIFAGCVVMEMTMNHYFLALPYLKRYLTAGSSDLATFTKLITPENRQEPRLIVTYVFPESSLAKNHIFQGAINLLEKVNGEPVRTINDYCSAMQKSLDTGYIVFEDIEGLTVVLSLANVIQQEQELSEKYTYPISRIFLKMVK